MSGLWLFSISERKALFTESLFIAEFLDAKFMSIASFTFLSVMHRLIYVGLF